MALGQHADQPLQLMQQAKLQINMPLSEFGYLLIELKLK
jgi:hypothetical protein